MVGLGPFLDEVIEGSQVIVDGHDGAVILDPDDETLERYELAQSVFQVMERRWSELRTLPAETRSRVQAYMQLMQARKIQRGM